MFWAFAQPLKPPTVPATLESNSLLPIYWLSCKSVGSVLVQIPSDVHARKENETAARLHILPFYSMPRQQTSVP